MAIKFSDKYLPITPEGFSNIPEGLKAVPRWVIWGGVKVPINGHIKKDGYLVGADITNEKTWLTFEEAFSLIGHECYIKSTGEYFHVVGLGFVVGDGYFCIDMDGGKDHGREPVPEQLVIDTCKSTGTYAEKSLSGCGYHVIGRCNFVTDENREHFSENRTSIEIELFTRRKFIAITGNRISAAAADICECSEAAWTFYDTQIRQKCIAREQKEREEREKYRSSITINPNDAEQFFLLNYPDILQYADPDHFKRGGKGGSLMPGEYSWIGALKAMDSIGVPRDAIIEWCRRGSSFAGERDVEKVLNERRGSSTKATTASLVKDAKANGWIPDEQKLTGEYKKNHEAAQQRQKYEKENAASIQARREKLKTICAENGIEYKETLICNFDFENNIVSIADEETGEIVYNAPGRAADPAPAAAAPKDTGTAPGADPGADPDAAAAASIGKTITTAAAAKTPEPDKGKFKLTVGGYEDVVIKPTDYLFFPWFPRGKLTAVQGDSNSSKSTFLYAVGAAVSTGSDIAGVPCEDPGNVLFITLEDDDSDILTAFTDAGGDVSKLRRITDKEQIARLTLSPAGAAALDDIIKKENIKMLVLDPIQHFLSGDMNKANETRPQLGRLMNMAAENNTVVGFIEHTGKDTSKAALHRGIGSVDIGAATRSIIQVVTDPQDDNYRIAFTVKNNTAATYDTQKAIRYQLKDHPGSFDHSENKRLHFHGHAEFIEIIPEYNERIYKRAMRKNEEEEANEMYLALEYAKDPLVITARKLIEQNPGGLFIGADDLIQKITAVCGHCPYDQSKSNSSGIYARVARIRAVLIDNDGIQIDIQRNANFPKAYTWENELFNPDHTRTRGFKLTAVPKADDDAQQMKF